MPSTTNRGEGNKLSTSAGVVYPCVRRLRHRRLLNFLWAEGFDAAFTSMAGETDACFSVRHLQRLVERGQWKDAVEYLCRFVPPELDRLGLEAQVLHRFLVAHMALAHIIAGTKEGDALAAKYSVYRNHGSSVMHGIIRLRSIMLTALHAKQQLRTSLDWERVRRKASEIVNRLAYRIPELKGMVLMPSGQFNNVVLPISFSPHRKYHGKKQFRRLRVSTLAKSYLQKRSLLSSSDSQDPRDELLNKALNWVSDIVDQSLKAGKRPESHQENPLQPSVTIGVTAAPISQAIFDTLAGPVTNPGTLPASSAVSNARNLASHVPLTGGPFLGTMFGAPFYQAMYGTLSGHCKNSGMVMNNAGVSVTPVSPTMIWPFSCAAKTTGMASGTNAGATVAPVSQAIFGTTAGPVMNPGMPSEANAGAPIATFSQITNFKSHAENCGTNKHSSQDNFNAKSIHQGSDLRKNQEEQLSTEVDLDPRTEQAPWAFGDLPQSMRLGRQHKEQALFPHCSLHRTNYDVVMKPKQIWRYNPSWSGSIGDCKNSEESGSLNLS